MLTPVQIITNYTPNALPPFSAESPLITQIVNDLGVQLSRDILTLSRELRPLLNTPYTKDRMIFVLQRNEEDSNPQAIRDQLHRSTTSTSNCCISITTAIWDTRDFITSSVYETCRSFFLYPCLTNEEQASSSILFISAQKTKLSASMQIADNQLNRSSTPATNFATESGYSINVLITDENETANDWEKIFTYSDRGYEGLIALIGLITPRLINSENNNNVDLAKAKPEERARLIEQCNFFIQAYHAHAFFQHISATLAGEEELELPRPSVFDYITHYTFEINMIYSINNPTNQVRTQPISNRGRMELECHTFTTPSSVHRRTVDLDTLIFPTPSNIFNKIQQNNQLIPRILAFVQDLQSNQDLTLIKHKYLTPVMP